MTSQAPVPLRSLVGPTTPALYAVDPGERKNCSVWDGTSLTEEKYFASFLLSLPSGSTVVTETTAHLYKPENRDALVSAARKAGVTLLAARSVYTARRRGDAQKTDDNDAIFIYWLYQEKPYLFSPMRLSSEVVHLGTKNEPGTSRQRVNRRLVLSRRTGYTDLQDIPEFLRGSGLPDHGIASIAICAAHAAEKGWGVRRLRRLAGDYAQGYPNIFRSNRNKHGIGKKFEGEGRLRRLSQTQRETLRTWSRLLRQALRFYKAQAQSPLRPLVGPRTPAHPVGGSDG
jgi:hypothetical protein